MAYTYKYPRPMVTTDILLFNKRGAGIELLLIKRLNDPYKNYWALPGGFVDKDEALIDAAKRELFEETSVKDVLLKQFKAFGDPNRDPRGHNICITYYAIINDKEIKAKAGDDAKLAEWFSLDKLPELAFDHSKIINEAIKELSL